MVGHSWRVAEVADGGEVEPKRSGDGEIEEVDDHDGGEVTGGLMTEDEAEDGLEDDEQEADEGDGLQPEGLEVESGPEEGRDDPVDEGGDGDSDFDTEGLGAE